MTLVHPALRTILRLRLRSTRRRMVRGLKSPKGAALFFMGMLLFTLWLAPSVWLVLSGKQGDPENLRTFFPLIILVMCAVTVFTSAGENAIYFSPAEVDFLFAGPFGRRELLVYKVLGTQVNTAFSALLVSVILLRWGGWWPAVYVGIYLTLQFVQLLAMTVMLIGQMAAEQAYTRARKLLLAVLGVLVAAALWQAASAQAEPGFLGLIQRVRESWALRYVLLPLEPFAGAVAAQGFLPDLLAWGSLALAVNLVLFGVVIWLDAEYNDAAVVISQKIYGRLQRARQSGMAPTRRTVARTRVPQFPWLGGAGPILWRQVTNAMRNSRTIIIALVIMAICFGAPLMSKKAEARHTLPLAISMLTWLTIFLSMMIRFDFRMDLDQIQWLKMLPLRPSAVAAGELLAPVLMTAAIQIILAGGVAYAAGQAPIAGYVAAFAIPVNLLMFGSENVMFLLSPARTVAFSPGDFQVFGRQLLLMLVKTLLLIVCGGTAGLIGGVAYWLLGRDKLVFLLTTWAALTLQSTLIIPCAAWAYRRFDVSLDTPL